MFGVVLGGFGAGFGELLWGSGREVAGVRGMGVRVRVKMAVKVKVKMTVRMKGRVKVTVEMVLKGRISGEADES